MYATTLSGQTGNAFYLAFDLNVNAAAVVAILYNCLFLRVFLLTQYNPTQQCVTKIIRLSGRLGKKRIGLVYRPAIFLEYGIIINKYY